MSSSAVVVRPVAGATDLDRFIRMPWRIYRDRPEWVPPLLADVRSVLAAEHPFHRHAEVQLFLAWRDRQVAGRIAGVVNHAYNEFHGDQLGFFGLFECENDPEVAGALLAQAEAWLRERGRNAVQGPFNLSTNDELGSPGVLVDGFDTSPVVMMSHTPPYYAGLLEQSGYSGVKDLVSYWIDRRAAPPERLARALARGARSKGITVRPLNLRQLERDIGAIEQIYNSAWERNWGFVPMTAAEIAYMAKHLRPVVRPELCLLAFQGEQPVAFTLALPDYNQALPAPGWPAAPAGHTQAVMVSAADRRDPRDHAGSYAGTPATRGGSNADGAGVRGCRQAGNV